MEDDRAGRRRRVGAVPPEKIREVIAANRFREHLIFVSGEPTLCPQFLDYVAFARQQGFKYVGVISNGRRFAYAPFVREALKRGLNHVILSIHGGHAKLHDGLTRTPGSFDELHQGLLNLSGLKRRGIPLRIDTSTVLNRRNCTPETLAELTALLAPHVDQMVLNVMQPFGRGLHHFERLMMRYSEVAGVLGEFFRTRTPESPPIYLVDIPHCTTEGMGIPDRVRGFVERYVRYELETAAAETDLWTRMEGSSGGAPVRRGLLDKSADPKVEALAQKHRDEQEQAAKTRNPGCDSCAYSFVCDGVWRNYVEKNGWEEFRPVPRKH
jgi:cyclic pyranopterin phosphate synthase